MANEISVGQLAGSIPDVVRKVALKARYDEAIINKLVSNADADVAGKSDRVSLSIMPSVSINSVGSGGSVTRQQLSLTAVEIVVNTWVECTVDIDDQAMRQSNLALVKSFSEGFGGALGQKQDLDLGAEQSNLTTYTVGSSSLPTPLDDSMVTLAKLKLDKNSSGANGKGRVPQKDRFWVLSPDAHYDLIKLARFSEAQNTGFDRGLQVENGQVSKLYGDPVYVTDQIATSGSARCNLYLHKEALGIATQQNFRITPLAKVQLSEAITADLLYGVKTVRADHGVVVYSAVNTDA